MVSVERALTCAASVMLLLASGGSAAAQEPADNARLAADGVLTLGEVYEMTRERSPVLRAAAAVVDASAAREPAAGLPEDPRVQVGVMNFPLPGFDADMPSIYSLWREWQLRRSSTGTGWSPSPPPSP